MSLASLGFRCVQWCFLQMRSEDPPRTETLDAWFQLAERNGKKLYLPKGIRHNHCAIAQSVAALRCVQPGEGIPHKPRAAARELASDALDVGAWHPARHVVSGLWLPKIGDLAIYDRSVPGKPETSWFGHVDRVVETADTGYRNIGANEGPGGAWRDQWSVFTNPKLLGFIAYPDPSVATISDDEKAKILAIRDLSLHEPEGITWTKA